MGAIIDFAEALWKGEKTTYAHHPLSEPYGLDKVTEDTWFHKFFSNRAKPMAIVRRLG
jgi:hypothetical protein